jgi:hypothetical protein
MDQAALEQGRAVQQAALTEAIDWYLCAKARGVTPITTVTAAAMLIGQIIGSQADNEAHVQYGLDQVLDMMRLTAHDWLAARAARH